MPSRLAGATRQARTHSPNIDLEDSAPRGGHAGTYPASDTRHLLDDDLVGVAGFVHDSLAHLKATRTALAALRRDPLDDDAMIALLRSLYLIKTPAGVLRFDGIATLVCAAWDLLLDVHSVTAALPTKTAALIEETVDQLERNIAYIHDAFLAAARIPRHSEIAPLLIDRMRQTGAAASSTPPSPPPLARNT